MDAQLPQGEEACGGFLFEEATVLVCGEPAEWLVGVVVAPDLFVEVVAVLMSALGQSRHDEPVNAGGVIAPDPAAPLACLALHQRHGGAAGDRSDEGVSVAVVAKRVCCLGHDRVGELAERVQVLE